LIDALIRLRGIELPEHPLMGRTFYTIGLMSGGVAPNVIPPAAEAEAMFRTVGDADDIRSRLGPLRELVSIEDILVVPPVTLMTVPGFQTEAFPYTTDIPFLSNWGRPLLYGPGSVLVAHTADEHVRKHELEEAVDGYVRLATTLLNS
jgi:acetylornithine deacetylase